MRRGHLQPHRRALMRWLQNLCRKNRRAVAGRSWSCANGRDHIGSRWWLARGVYVTAFPYPVMRGSARRFLPAHTREELEFAVGAFGEQGVQGDSGKGQQ